MSGGLKSVWLLQIIVLWSVAGFPLLAALTTALGGNNTGLSVAGRGAVAVAALLLLSRVRIRPTPAILLFAAFWLAYGMRLAIGLHIQQEPLSRAPGIYWIWAIGACLLPALAMLSGFNANAVRRLLRPLLILSLITIALFLAVGGTGYIRSDGTVSDINRWNVGSLNPISMGHLGATACLLGLAVLTGAGQGRDRRILALLAIGGGGLIALLANSRGPMLALAAGFLLLALARSGHRRGLGILLAAIAAVAALVLSGHDLVYGEGGILARFTAMTGGQDLSAQGRFTAFGGALAQFLGAPLFGDGIEERITGYYPHNVTLEAFMATGLTGGLPFLALTLAALRAAWQLARDGSPVAWVGLLAVQYIVAGQFSGAIYQSPAMWVMMALTLSARRYHVRCARLAIRPAHGPRPATPVPWPAHARGSHA